MIKNCAYCNIEFETANSRKLYHSDSCRSSASQLRCNAKKPKQNCLWCTKEFQPKWDNQQCCTPLCSSFYVNNKPEIVAKKSKVLRENGNLKGEKNPSYGKSPSKETREKLSIASTAYIKEHGNSFQGKRHSDEARRVMSEKAKIRARTPEARDQMSKWNVDRILANDGVNPSIKHHKKGIYVSPKVGDIPFDSSYEEQAYKILDKLSTVESYSRCKFYIAYEIDKKTRRYIPDILVSYTDGTQQVIEIKPATFVEDKVNQAKFAAAEPYCAANDLEFSVWTEEQLFT